VFTKDDVIVFGQIINETLRHPFIEAFESTDSVDVFKETEEVLKTERKQAFKTEHEHFCVLTDEVDSVFCTVIVVDDTLVQFTDEHDNALHTFIVTKQPEVQTI